jgi:hypothetical protein
LAHVSRAHINLVASHPDRTGGIGFLSEVQSKFGLLILAYGVSNIAATVAYKTIIEKAPWSTMTVWGPIVCFVIGAPLLFTIPLFMFTKQLYRAKRRAIEKYEERATERAREFERKWLQVCENGEIESFTGSELAALTNLNLVFDRVESMRVVPFDLRSFGELIAAAAGPILPILPYYEILPDPFVKSIEQVLHIFGGG